MTDKFKEIVALILYHNVKCRLDIGINKTYYLIKYDGDNIVWEMDDKPEENNVYFYNDLDERFIFNTPAEYILGARTAEVHYGS